MLPVKLRIGMKVVLETSAVWSSERFIGDSLSEFGKNRNIEINTIKLINPESGICQRL